MMSRKLKWSRVTIALALIAALAVVSPALGGPSLRKLVKNEVARQIAKATGPAGSPGSTGNTGPAGTSATSLWAVIKTSQNCTGTTELVRGSGVTGFSNDCPTVGAYRVDFNRDISGCSYVGSIGDVGAGIAPAGELSVERAAMADLDSIFVRVHDSSGANVESNAGSDGFHVAVFC